MLLANLRDRDFSRILPVNRLHRLPVFWEHKPLGLTMTFSTVSHLMRQQPTWAKVATGSVVFAGLVIGSLVRYRDELREAFRKTTTRRTADTPGTGYADWSKADLYQKAREEELPGRSQMSKAELIEALRSA